VKKITEKRGVDVVFEHVGSATWAKSVESLAAGGRVVTCGVTTGYDVKLDLRFLFAKHQSMLDRLWVNSASCHRVSQVRSFRASSKP